jgi:hypothetical protein
MTENSTNLFTLIWTQKKEKELERRRRKEKKNPAVKLSFLFMLMYMYKIWMSLDSLQFNNIRMEM